VKASRSKLRGDIERKSRYLHDENSVLCRIAVLENTTEETEGDATTSLDEIRCIPIEDERETDDSFQIRLPDDFVKSYRSKIYQGLLMVSISHAVYSHHELFLGKESQYTIVEESHRYRHLLARHLQVTGNVTVAVVRVSTPAESPVPTTTQLSSVYFGDHGFQKQYGACSGGKLRVKNCGVYDVKIPQTKASLENDAMKLVDAAQEQLRKDLGITQVSSLANKVIMCLPEGTYAGFWSARAIVNHWLMQIRSDYCLSLSASMHEMGTFVYLLFVTFVRLEARSITYGSALTVYWFLQVTCLDCFTLERYVEYSCRNHRIAIMDVFSQLIYTLTILSRISIGRTSLW
jgi:hypothetical protein